MTDQASWGAAAIEETFGFHKATVEGPNATAPKHMEVRVNYREFLEYLDRVIPAGRAKSVVFTKLQEASMFTHWAIAQTAPLVDETFDPRAPKHGVGDGPLDSDYRDVNPASDDYTVDRD